MKKLIAFLLLFGVVTTLAIQSCQKEGSNAFTPPSIDPAGLPPVASAGTDTVIVIPICEAKATATLDGRLSFNPLYNTQLKYLWKQVYGPMQAFTGVDSTAAIVTVNNLVTGGYGFVLEVVDTHGQSSRDTVLVNVYDKTDYKNQDLDAVGEYHYSPNIEYYGIGYDEFLIQGNVKIGNDVYTFSIYETTPAGADNTSFTNFFNLVDATNTYRFIGGNCSVDFETLYLNGGGDFDGTITIISGSAFTGCEDTIKDFPPIQIKGNFSAVTSNIVTLKLKGDVAF